MKFHAEVAVAVTLTFAWPAGPARAQAGAQSIAVAKALYDRAATAMKERDFASACPQLEEAVKLEPEALGARMKLAECYEGLGKLASAWATYLQVEGAASKVPNQEARRKKAHESAEALKPRLAQVVVEVREEIRGYPGLEVRLDGMALGTPLFGVPIPVDQGDHFIEVSATGKKPVKKGFELNVDGELNRVNVPLLHDIRVDKKPDEAPTPAAPARRPTPARRAERVPLDDAPGTLVSIESDDKDVTVGLYRVNAELSGAGTSFGYGAQGPTFGVTSMQATATSIVCLAPCNREIDGSAGHQFFVGGDELAPSERFRLSGFRTMNLAVSPGKSSHRVGGTWLMAFGIAGVIMGPIMIGIGAAKGGSAGATFAPAGGVTLGIGALFMAIGVPLWWSGHTTYTIK